MVFILSALWGTRIRGLWKLPDGGDWLWGKLGLVLMGGAMLSKSLIQLSVWVGLCSLPVVWPMPPPETPVCMTPPIEVLATKRLDPAITLGGLCFPLCQLVHVCSLTCIYNCFRFVWKWRFIDLIFKYTIILELKLELSFISRKILFKVHCKASGHYSFSFFSSPPRIIFVSFSSS